MSTSICGLSAAVRYIGIAPEFGAEDDRISAAKVGVSVGANAIAVRHVEADPESSMEVGRESGAEVALGVRSCSRRNSSGPLLLP
jgi:hypothetical protein